MSPRRPNPRQGPSIRPGQATTDGGCNFCTPQPSSGYVLVVESPGGLQIRICTDCQHEIARSGRLPR